MYAERHRMSRYVPEDTVARFNDRADDYVKYRPSYPAAAIDAILDGLGAPERLVAADVGAGTGISARLLGDRGARVIAVEPGEVMRGAAAPHPRVEWVSATAQATGVADASVDLVLCAQSFHWFHTREAVAEFARILKPGGRLAIMWNRRSTADPLTAAYRQAILDAGGEVPAERMPFEPGIISADGLFTPVQRHAWPNTQRLDRAGLIGRAHSASYVPKSGEAGQQLLNRLHELYASYADAAGFVTLVYETEVFLSSRIPSILS
jgi:SAM-dependent methyltransferase